MTQARDEAQATGALMNEGRYGDALGKILQGLTVRAVQTLGEQNIWFEKTEHFSSGNFSGAYLTRYLANAARAAVEEKRKDLTDTAIDKAEAAADVLDSVATARERLGGSVPTSVGELSDFIAEMLILGGVLGQTSAWLYVAKEEIFRDAERARKQRNGRSQNAQLVNQDRVSWHEPAKAKCRRACEQRPSITSDQLASLIREDPKIEAPGHEQVLSTVREWRKHGIIPKRVPPVRHPKPKVGAQNRNPGSRN